MNSYERIRAAVSHQTPDRIPCDFAAEPLVIQRLFDYFGIDSMKELLDIFQVDRRLVGPKYIGPRLRTFEDGSYEVICRGGPVYKDIIMPNGEKTEAIVHFPWADVTRPEDLAGRYGWDGHIDWWDFSVIPAQIDALEEAGPYWIAAHGDPSGLQHLCMWVGDERFYLLLAMDEDLAMAMIEKHNEFRLEHALRTLEAGGGRIHELHGGGDYGGQTNLLISVPMFRHYFRQLYIDFYTEIKKNFDVEIFFHTDGAVADLIPELIDVGVTILDPVQPSARGMDFATLKRKFGDRLTFHGGIDVQQVLPFATPEEVRAEVRRAMTILGEGGGYILAPTHNIQPDTPLENILAMYEEALGRPAALSRAL
jgi:uroporphyrinogen decarboxylase